MSTTEINRIIHAPKEQVFAAIANIENFAEAVPSIVKIEFLTEQKEGIGTRFKETRTIKGREASTELEVIDYLENHHIRLISDAGGTIWDSLFTITSENQKDDEVHLNLIMTAKPYKFFSKLLNPLIKGMVKKAIESDMDAIKKYCED